MWYGLTGRDSGRPGGWYERLDLPKAGDARLDSAVSVWRTGRGVRTPGKTAYCTVLDKIDRMMVMMTMTMMMRMIIRYSHYLSVRRTMSDRAQCMIEQSYIHILPYSALGHNMAGHKTKRLKLISVDQNNLRVVARRTEHVVQQISRPNQTDEQNDYRRQR